MDDQERNEDAEQEYDEHRVLHELHVLRVEARHAVVPVHRVVLLKEVTIRAET